MVSWNRENNAIVVYLIVAIILAVMQQVACSYRMPVVPQGNVAISKHANQRTLAPFAVRQNTNAIYQNFVRVKANIVRKMFIKSMENLAVKERYIIRLNSIMGWRYIIGSGIN